MRSTGTGPAVTKSHPANPGQCAGKPSRGISTLAQRANRASTHRSGFDPTKASRPMAARTAGNRLPGSAHGGKATAGLPPRPMPPACPVVAYARRYPPASHLARCHRLARWWLTLAATRRPSHLAGMPPACPVVAHARRYPPAIPPRPDATGLPGGGSRSPLPAGHPLRPDATGLPGGRLRSPLPAGLPSAPECHRLARWWLTLAATRRPTPSGRCHRLARWWLTLAATRRPPPCPMPPACPVVAYARRYPPASHRAPGSPPRLQRTFGDWRRRGPCNRAEPNNPPGKPVGF